jgi:hypothetical protein
VGGGLRAWFPPYVLVFVAVNVLGFAHKPKTAHFPPERHFPAAPPGASLVLVTWMGRQLVDSSVLTCGEGSRLSKLLKRNAFERLCE